MAEIKKAPKPRKIRVKVPIGDGDTTTRTGIDIDDVLRGVLVELRNKWGCSTRQLAQRIGLPQQSISGYLDKRIDHSARIIMLSRICAALETTPGALLATAPAYRDLQDVDRIDPEWLDIGLALTQENRQAMLEISLICAHADIARQVIEPTLTMARAFAKANGLDLDAIAKTAR